MRKPALVIGVLLLLLGGLIAAGVLDFERERKLMDMGPVEVTKTRREQPPINLGYILIALGAAALVGGALARK